MYACLLKLKVASIVELNSCPLIALLSSIGLDDAFALKRAEERRHAELGFQPLACQNFPSKIGSGRK
jgi:hypothetical protein